MCPEPHCVWLLCVYKGTEAVPTPWLSHPDLLLPAPSATLPSAQMPVRLQGQGLAEPSLLHPAAYLRGVGGSGGLLQEP